MTSKTKNLIVSVFSLCVGAFLFANSCGILPGMRNDMGSGFFPKVVALSIIAVALVVLVMSLKDKERGAEGFKGDILGGVFSIVLILAYVCAFQSVGFIIATVLYLYLQILVLTPSEKLNLPFLCTFSFAVPLGVYALFVYGLNTPLPIGMFGF